MAARSAIAIDLGRRRFGAVLAGRSGRVLRVRKSLVEPVPADLGGDDAAALGAWVGRQLRRAGFPRGSATIAIAREHVALKRLTLPSADDSELPGMTWLAMSRELPFDAGTAVIDHVVIDRGATSTTVLAVAVPRPVLEFARQASRHAGLSIERVSLRSMGAAALVAGLDGAGDGVLAVDITGDGVEFSVIVDGFVRFSRAGDLPPLEDPRELLETIVTETRRTWMSYRIVEDANEVRRAVVIGDRRLGAAAAESIAEVLKVSTDTLESHPLVRTGGADMEGAWPLAGLLLEPALGRRTVDFIHPRRPPDVAARRRQRLLAAAGAVLLVAGAAFTAARFDLARLNEQKAQLERQRKDLRAPYERARRDRLKVAHLERWEEAGADWLEHLAGIVAIAPQADRLVLDSWAGTLDFRGVEHDRRAGRFVAPREIRFIIEGEAADRQTADAFRGAIVRTETYRITTTGPDAGGGKRLPIGFRYLLRSEQGRPEAAR